MSPAANPPEWAIADFVLTASALTTQRQILEEAAVALSRVAPYDAAQLLVVPEDSEPLLHLCRRSPCDRATAQHLHVRCSGALRALGTVVGDGPVTRDSSGVDPGPTHYAILSDLHVPLPGPGARPVGMISLAAFREDAFGARERELVPRLAAMIAELLRRASARILDERRRTTLLLDSMADGVIMTDHRSEVFVINPAARRMLGFGPDVDVTTHVLKERLGFYPFDLVARAGFSREELTIDDQRLDSIVSPVNDGGGRPVGVVVVLRDITEQKELDQRKEELLASASHELRTPLTSISGALEILLEPYLGPLSDKQRTYVEMARESCGRLTTLVNDLLDAARLERGKLPLKLAPVSLDEVVRDCVERFAPSAAAKRVAVQLKGAPEGVRIVGDADRLGQVLNNLLSNAIRFTPDNGLIEVEVFGPSIAASHVGVSVWNNGAAIPEERRESIFERFGDRFEPAGPGGRRVGGTGLGLAISRAIVEGHGGKIWVENAPIGTKFVFTLPAGTGDSAPRAADPIADSFPIVTESLVLVIDDDPYAAYVLKGVLMAAGHRVHVIHEADEAVAWAREHKPDLVTVELRMPGIDGAAFVEMLRHDPDTRRAAVVAVSAGADRESALVAGADAYFTKPVQVDPFRQSCLRLLSEKARDTPARILIVDDDAGIRMICREALERAGYTTRSAPDGMQALEEVKRFRPDLILLDVMMPDLDGFQTARRLRADRETAMTPIIFVSARGQTADKVRAFKLGAEDYLVKPFDTQELVARVEKAVARRERELGASPTTRLPGANAIEAEIERRLGEKGTFAFCYVDLDNLKAFNDYYGIAKADGVIRQTGDLMRQVVAREGSPNDFIGHIAGDDFVFVTTPDRIDHIGETICKTFDRLVPLYYDKKDRERGYIETPDRYGVVRRFPLMSVSVAALTTIFLDQKFKTYADLALASAEAKKQAKAVEGSCYVRDGVVLHPHA